MKSPEEKQQLNTMFETWKTTGSSMVELAKETGFSYSQITHYFTQRLKPERERTKKVIKYRHF